MATAYLQAFAEPIICALCGVIFLAFGASFLAGASIGIGGFAALCKLVEMQDG
jgi:hypothetical protein